MDTLREQSTSAPPAGPAAAPAIPAHVGSPSGVAPVFALVGNPNSGKSTLFNALTGLRQKVGNYPGVTVEKKIGECFSQHGKALRVVDLPGAYSLAARSPDEAIMRDVLLGRRSDTPQPDRIICIVDATNLERNLYLVHQILDLGRPVILVLNMMDLAREAGLDIRVARLEHELGIPVIACEAAHGKGIVELKLAMSRPEPQLPRHRWDIPAPIAPAVSELQASLIENDRRQPLIARAEALLLLTDLDPLRVAGSTPFSERTTSILHHWKQRWEAGGIDWSGTLVNSRYEAIGRLCEEVVRRDRADRESVSDRIDRVVVHPVWGWVTLGTLMAAIFLSIFMLAEHPMGWIESLMASLADWVGEVLPEGDLRSLISDGAIAGVAGVVVFLPQILILFFFLGLLENTGYMARAAFIMDRLMSRVGLNGKSFIPLLSSYACAIPGIMATRTIENPKDRLVTILVAPLMSCSARLPVYLLLIPALMPNDVVSLPTKVGMMLLLYALGTFSAFGFAWLFKKYLLRAAAPLMIMELPPYRMPSIKDVLLHMAERGWMFLRRAGTIILGISIILWALSAYPKAGPDATPTEQSEQSFAGRAGHVLEPVIEPLGFDWRIGVGLISSFAAREVFNTAMGVVFSVEEGEDEDETANRLRSSIRAATWPDGRPLFTPLVCFTLMVFYVFAMQCASTVAVVRRETNSWRWPLFQIFYLTGTAYVMCLIVYQGGRLLGLG